MNGESASVIAAWAKRQTAPSNPPRQSEAIMPLNQGGPVDLREGLTWGYSMDDEFVGTGFEWFAIVLIVAAATMGLVYFAAV